MKKIAGKVFDRIKTFQFVSNPTIELYVKTYTGRKFLTTTTGNENGEFSIEIDDNDFLNLDSFDVSANNYKTQIFSFDNYLIKDKMLVFLEPEIQTKPNLLKILLFIGLGLFVWKKIIKK